MRVYPRSMDKKFYLLFESDQQFYDAMHSYSHDHPYTYKRFYSTTDKGYEVTSKGDRRFSPFFMDFHSRYDNPDEYINVINSYRGLIYELALIGINNNFTDMFDKDGGQNKIYAEYLNKYYQLWIILQKKNYRGRLYNRRRLFSLIAAGLVGGGVGGMIHNARKNKSTDEYGSVDYDRTDYDSENGSSSSNKLKKIMFGRLA